MGEARRPADDLFSAWRAVMNVIELDDSGMYHEPLPEAARAALGRCASELSAAMAEESARGKSGGAA